jgi:hypothetical protein
MAAAEYSRPQNCHFCDFPAAEGRVRLSEVDRDKLSKWFTLKLGAEPDETEYEEAVFCVFCVLDARCESLVIFERFFLMYLIFFFRFEGDFCWQKFGQKPCDWWSECEHLEEYYSYYSGMKISLCHDFCLIFNIFQVN